MPLSPAREDVLEERKRGAWATYALTLEGLEGREYEEAEEQAWATLQRELALVASAEAGLPSAPGGRGRV